ncbi:uncharacterized protein MELLADRAFT_88487 [Melampsora larici-populina 98AG31]|uniref:Uncharacterized protein n=1 Tax=Melampsora larici-populina (strain 98AG31 / pathotype 3-4-7) TaxID=747676 RepID=F4RRW7_MELLP|nr:uncharacterized protein MELLADRAFT_88487 [Melampsora larici-populina 98AG31]EGG04878.1 hypothetical protein MELLADRAFT_88487 [Melampsora larici-populina 98AG31]
MMRPFQRASDARTTSAIREYFCYTSDPGVEKERSTRAGIIVVILRIKKSSSTLYFIFVDLIGNVAE